MAEHGMIVHPRGVRDGLLLRIELIAKDAANPLIREEAECNDIFSAMHELEHVTGPRLRQRLHDAAALNLLRIKPIEEERR